MNLQAIIGPGEQAPDFDLAGADGEHHALSRALRDGPVLLTFFQLDCQACQGSFLAWDAAVEAYAGDRFQLWAVSLDAERDAAQFWEKSGVSFPVLFDDGHSVEAYRLISTPTHVLVGMDGRVIASYDAFDRAAWNAMLEHVAADLDVAPIALGPEAGDFRPGCTIHQ
ncbi:MAG: TlpA family protein disulfide reductase [Dehalococcoidia bacterium]|nr:MAG: TlpA family protein disulfide reductase [Dehalococcoidia bacterium]